MTRLPETPEIEDPNSLEHPNGLSHVAREVYRPRIARGKSFTDSKVRSVDRRAAALLRKIDAIDKLPESAKAKLLQGDALVSPSAPLSTKRYMDLFKSSFHISRIPPESSIRPDIQGVNDPVFIGARASHRRQEGCSIYTRPEYEWLDRRAAIALEAADALLRAQGKGGIHLESINPAGRSQTDQDLIYQCASEQIHAHSGSRSSHQDGMSIDVKFSTSDPTYNKAVFDALELVGFRHIYCKDGPHFEYKPGAPTACLARIPSNLAPRKLTSK
jgi:hypothetical protein